MRKLWSRERGKELENTDVNADQSTGPNQSTGIVRHSLCGVSAIRTMSSTGTRQTSEIRTIAT